MERRVAASKKRGDITAGICDFFVNESFDIIETCDIKGEWIKQVLKRYIISKTNIFNTCG